MIWSSSGRPATARSSQSRQARGLVRVARAVEQRESVKRRVAQPAVAVVPVPHAAERLGQRRRRRGDDPAGRRVGQRLERDERAQDGVARASRTWHAVRRPLAPPASVVGEGLLGVDALAAAARCDGYQVRTNGTRSPGGDGEVGHGVRSSPASIDRASQARARPGRRPRATPSPRPCAPTGRSSRSRTG